MRILWHSNAPWVGSGYGNQTALFCKLMAEAGHEVIVRAFHGLQGAPVQWGPITVLPGSFHSYGEDVLIRDWQEYKPDAHITLIDVWIYQPDVLKAVPLTAWCPVDHDPLPPPVAEKLPFFTHIWAMSRFGERKMREKGFDPYYVPHGVDLAQYQPKDRTAARKIYNVDDDQLFVVSVAANTGTPSRKNLDRMLKAWSIFVRTHPKAFLWLHSEPYGARQGLDLPRIVDFYEIPRHTVKFANPHLLQKGDYNNDWMNQLYNAADVFWLPSRGEGFGIPALEAQASGTPVIVSDFSAQHELGEAGYRVPIDPIDDLEYSLQGSEHAIPKVSELVKSLEWAAEHKGDAALRVRARDFAMEYDAHKIFTQHMFPALERIAGYAAPYVKGRKPTEEPKALQGAAD